MKSSPLKLILLLISIIAIIIIGAGSFALAYWSGTPEQAISGNDAAEVDNSENATTKYLIFAPIQEFSTDYCFEYTDANGWVLKYEYGADYEQEGGPNKAGSRAAAAAADITAVSASIATYGVKVIGYIGTLGKEENLVIPSSITWNNISNIPVKNIDIKMNEYKNTMVSLTGVEIPASVLTITGASFTEAGALERVYFKGINTTTITKASGFIADTCFVGMNVNITYYNASGAEITNIRA